jgi:glycosyltransferase involved in cell wall biosynthesis
MQPLVSILIPCYNAEAWLAQTLESALSQTWPNTEIIVVDDGSTDRSLEIAQSFESRGVKVISQSNQGVCAARNLAFKAARGDFIQYLDADDLLAPEKIERQIALLSVGNGNCIAAGEWGYFYEHPSETEFNPDPIWADLSPVDWLATAWEGNWMMNPGAWLVPRSIAEAAGPWNETIILDEDGEYFCRVLLASQGVKFCWGAKAFYRTGIRGSLSRGQSDRARTSRFRALELCMSHLLAREDSPRTRRACANRFQRFFYEVYPDLPDLCTQAELRVRELGGSDVRPVIGSKLKPVCAVLGWRRAKKIQKLVYRLGLEPQY